jgi:hypothetical protein
MKRYLVHLSWALVLSGCLAPKPINEDSHVLAGGAISVPIKKISGMKSIAPILAHNIRAVDLRGPKAKVREAISKTLIDGLIQENPDTALIHGNPNAPDFDFTLTSYNRNLEQILKKVVNWETQSQGDELSVDLQSSRPYPDLVQILADGNSPITLFAERAILSKLLMSDLLVETHLELAQLRTRSPLMSADQKRSEQLEGLLNVLEIGFVPETPSNLSLDKQLVREANGRVSLKKTLAKARRIVPNEILFSRNPIIPTPKEELLKVITKSEADLVDSMGTMYYYYATGSQKSSNFEGACFLWAVKFLADCKQEIKRFNAIFNNPKLPRVAGEIFRGLSNVPSIKMEEWLTLAARGKPLYLGIDNTPKTTFATRLPEVATKFLDSQCGSTQPDSYDVLLVISQKGGVSTETLFSKDAKQRAVILSTAQKFRVIEVFQTGDPRQLVIKLEEI